MASEEEHEVPDALLRDRIKAQVNYTSTCMFVTT